MKSSRLPQTPRRRFPRLLRLWGFWLDQPQIVRYGFLTTVVLTVAAVGYAWLQSRDRARAEEEVAVQWERFTKSAQTDDNQALRAALEAILRVKPNDPLAQSRLASLQTGEAEATDDPMILLLLHRHVRLGNWPGAAREAEKRLQRYPQDWFAHCVKVQFALLNQDRASARNQLDQLPQPNDPQANVTPVGLLMAFELFRACERDETPLRRYVRDAVVPALGSLTARDYPVSIQLQLLECYLEGLDPNPNRELLAGLSQGWTGAMQLVQNIQTSEWEPGIGPRLGTVLARLGRMLVALHEDRQIRDDQFSELQKEHGVRLRKLWQQILDQTPSDPVACHGLALLDLQEGNWAAARESILRGLQAQGDHAGLLALHSWVLQRENQPREALKQVWQAAERQPKNPALWLLAASTASAIRERDAALTACRKAREAAPGSAWVLRTEAFLELEAGDAHRAAQIFREMGLPRILEDPQATLGYVKALLSAGLPSHVLDLLPSAHAAARQSRSPVIAGAILIGVIESNWVPSLADPLQRFADQLLDAWPTDPSALLPAALLAFHIADHREPRWEIPAQRRAAQLLERARLRLPRYSEILVRLAFIKLNRENDPKSALELCQAAHQTRNPGERQSGWLTEVWGAALNASQQWDSAVRLLEAARQDRTISGNGLLQLARAYHAQGKWDQALEALEAARPYPRRPHEEVEFRNLATTLQQRKS